MRAERNWGRRATGNWKGDTHAAISKHVRDMKATVLMMDMILCHLCSVPKPVMVTERWNESDSILLSRCSHCSSKRWWKRRHFCLFLPYLQMIDDSQLLPKNTYFTFCRVWHDALHCDVSDDNFGGRLEAFFSPFPCWWWRRCLLWLLVWWCILHLHNVSVRRGREGEENKSYSDTLWFFLLSHIWSETCSPETKMYSSEEGWNQYSEINHSISLSLLIPQTGWLCRMFVCHPHTDAWYNLKYE